MVRVWARRLSPCASGLYGRAQLGRGHPEREVGGCRPGNRRTFVMPIRDPARSAEPDGQLPDDDSVGGLPRGDRPDDVVGGMRHASTGVAGIGQRNGGDRRGGGFWGGCPSFLRPPPPPPLTRA